MQKKPATYVDRNMESTKEQIISDIREMENILDKAIQKIDALERMIADYEDFQPEIKKLEAYYASQQWKDAFAMDEAGSLPKDLKRGVLSEDGIWNMLEQNRRLSQRIRILAEGVKE